MLVLEAIGNLGADAIIKDLNGQKYIAFSVAHTESYKDSQGQRHERTTWVSCLKYGESQVINYLKKGTRVFIRGELSAKAYEAGGALQAGINCRVRELQLLGGNRADQTEAPQQAEGVSQEDTLKAVEKLGQDVRALVFNATGIDTHLLYNRTKVN